MELLTLNILSSAEKREGIECDSVHLVISDTKQGKGGGSYGIRKGHVKALISLGKGDIKAFLSGKEIFSFTVDGGFATVENNIVTCVCTK